MTDAPPPARRSLAERIPNAYVLIFGLLVLAAGLTWVIPPGQFERAVRDGRTVVVPGSYQRVLPDGPLPPGNEVRPEPQGVFDVLRAPLQGFVQAAEIIVFILVVGGAFKILEATGAVRAGIGRIIVAFRGRELLLIPIVMILFSLAGAVFGMSEETIPFVMLFVPLALALGYDSITGAAMPFVAAGAGFAAAFINPFTLGIAQGIAELPPVSGIGYRVAAWVVITAVAIAWVMRHAARVRRDPTLSPTWEQDRARRAAEGLGGEAAERSWQALDEPMTGTHRALLVLFAAAIGLLIVGVLRWGWYIEEIGALFLGFGVLAAVVARLGGERTVEAFLKGAAELIGAALVVGLARGILVVAQNGGIIDPVLHFLSGGIGQLPPVLSAQVMFLAQSALNFFVPSGSGQAALSMPLMAPLADLVGVTRQTAVLAYQFGDGFTNLIIPTSGVLLGVLGAARISWITWARWMLPLQVIFVILGLLLLIPPVLMGWGPH
jgi:uncharacterized ion transporter superfamily protein YfcC